MATPKSATWGGGVAVRKAPCLSFDMITTYSTRVFFSNASAHFPASPLAQRVSRWSGPQPTALATARGRSASLSSTLAALRSRCTMGGSAACSAAWASEHPISQLPGACPSVKTGSKPVFRVYIPSNSRTEANSRQYLQKCTMNGAPCEPSFEKPEPFHPRSIDHTAGSAGSQCAGLAL